MVGVMTSLSSSPERLQRWLRHLYESRAADAQQFRYGLLAFDAVTILFIVATSFVPRNRVVEALDVVFGLIILADFSARLFISRHRLRDLMHPVTWADAAAIVSLLAPLVGEAAGFLRILRTLRLLHSYQLLMRLRADFPYFRAHEGVIIAISNLAVFLFIMNRVRLRNSAPDQPGDLQLCGRAVFHRHDVDHYRLRGHHASGHRRPADLGDYNDLWRDAIKVRFQSEMRPPAA
jgi:hypothetical protein